MEKYEFESRLIIINSLKWNSQNITFLIHGTKISEYTFKILEHWIETILEEIKSVITEKSEIEHQINNFSGTLWIFRTTKIILQESKQTKLPSNTLVQ